jgi:hypothetical protein
MMEIPLAYELCRRLSAAASFFAICSYSFSHGVFTLTSFVFRLLRLVVLMLMLLSQPLSEEQAIRAILHSTIR